MFTVGAVIFLLWLLMVVGRPLAAKSRFGGWFLFAGILLMLASLLTLTWRYLP